MYTVTLDNALIHNPAAGDEACLVLNGVITKKVNCADSFSFTIYPANPAYSVISLMVSKIKVYKDGTCIFSGRPLSEETDFDNGKTVLCESDFAVLNDTIMRPYEFQGTVGDYVRLLVNAHNEATTSDKQITVGSITVTDPNNNIVRSTSDYVTVMEELIEKTVNNMGGYLRMIPGTMTLDYLQDSLDGTNQTLEIGKNILDFNRSISTEALATALIPLGKEDEETGERVTIKSVNGGSDFISDQAAENERGRIYTTMTWDDVSVPANLLTKARAALTDLKRMASRIEMSAVDLKDAGLDVDSLDFFEYITVVDAVHNVSGQYLITERKYNLSAPEKDMVTFGGADNTISGQTSSARSAADRMGARIVNTLSDIIERQTDLIKGGAGGHVVIGTDQDGKPNEIFFMDTDSVETARKILRINMNGIGFSTSGINGPYSNAWTIDGNLNASFIHTGILRSATNTTNWWNLDTGEINISDNANIAGWEIESSYLGKRGTLSGTPYLAFMQAPETPTGNGGVFGLRTGTEDNYSFPFIVRYNGTVEATNAVIEGTITTDDLTATGGTIGGWTIGTSGLSSGTTFDNHDYEVGLWSPTTPQSTTPAFYVGYPTGVGSAWEYVFKVDYSGKLTATGGGTIGAWTLASGAANSSAPAQGSLYSGMSTLDSRANGVYIGYDGIALGGGAFKVTRAGVLNATSATISGDITATSGEIAGWSISSSLFQKTFTSGGTEYNAFIQNGSSYDTRAFGVQTKASGESSYTQQFHVRYDGKLYARNAEITGKITSSEGTIGNWTINTNAIKREATINSKNYEIALWSPVSTAPTGSTAAIYVWNKTDNEYPFRVNYNGSAEITGKITASSGSIAGWDINSTYLGKSGTLDGTPYMAYIQAPETPTANNAFISFRTGAEGSYSYPFIVKYDGSVTATDANITGKIYSSEGKIGNWTIDANSITREATISSKTYQIGLWSPVSTAPTAGTAAIYVWNKTDNTYPFRVNYGGNAEITGKITASSGAIGGWTISDTTIYRRPTIGGVTYEAGLWARGDSTITASDQAFYVYNRSTGSYPFYVTYEGKLKATNVEITGGTVSGSLITSGISASNITTGTLNADRIGATTISTNKLLVNGQDWLAWLNTNALAYADGTKNGRVLRIGNWNVWGNSGTSVTFSDASSGTTSIRIYPRPRNWTTYANSTVTAPAWIVFSVGTAIYGLSASKVNTASGSNVSMIRLNSDAGTWA